MCRRAYAGEWRNTRAVPTPAAAELSPALADLHASPPLPVVVGPHEILLDDAVQLRVTPECRTCPG